MCAACVPPAGDAESKRAAFGKLSSLSLLETELSSEVTFSAMGRQKEQSQCSAYRGSVMYSSGVLTSFKSSRLFFTAPIKLFHGRDSEKRLTAVKMVPLGS